MNRIFHCIHKYGAREACTVIAFAVTLSFAVSSFAASDVHIVSSTPHELIFDYSPAYRQARTFSINGKHYRKISFSKESSIVPKKPGAPDFPGREFIIGVPSFTGNTISVVSASYETIQGTPAPAPKMIKPKDATGYTEQYQIDANAYKLAESYPQTTVELRDYGMLRNERVAHIVLSPIQCAPGSSSFRRATHIRVRVNFGTEVGVAAGQFDNNLKGLLLNENAATQWAVAPLTKTGLKRTMSYNQGTQYARIDVQNDGVVIVTAAQLTAAGINVNQINPSSVQIFGNGGRPLPETMDSTDASPREIAIIVDTDMNGHFKDVIFYGKGPYGWNYNSTNKTFSHYVNIYSSVSSYIFTYGAVVQGKRIPTALVVGNATYFPSTFVNHVFREDDNLNTFVLAGGPGSGRVWWSSQINNGQSLVYTNQLPGFANTGVVSYNVAVGGIDGANNQSFNVNESSVPLGTVSISTTGGGADGGIVWDRNYGSFSTQATAIGPGGQSAVQFNYNSSGNGYGAVNWLEIAYSANFTALTNATNNQSQTLHFWAPDTTTATGFTLQNFATQPDIFDVTSDSAVELLPVTYNSTFGTYSIQLALTAGTAREIFAATPASYTQPAVQLITLAGLRNPINADSFIIITDTSLLEAANTFQSYRSSSLPTKVVTTNQIYNEFSGGMRDATAIRDFLRYANDQWNGKPFYVLLFGDGSYNYKSDPTNMVPPYESPDGAYNSLPDNFDEISGSRPTDSYYALISPQGQYINLALGRISVHTIADADNVVAKIKTYETASDQTPWRNNLTFVASEDYAGSSISAGTTFNDDSEDMANNPTDVPAAYDLKKIYLAEYPTVYSGFNDTGGRTKPGAYDDIVSAFNNGTLMMNWIGHGNPHIWAYEQIFVSETTIPELTNASRLAFVSAATCDFGRFDDPTYQSGTQRLMDDANGGAIGLFASAREVYETPNIEIDEAFYSNLLGQHNIGPSPRLGAAFWKTRQTIYDADNDSKFYIQGDPTLRLLIPANPAVVDSVNKTNVTVNVAQVQALMPVTVSGTVNINDSTVWTGFSGTANVTMYDATVEDSVLSDGYVFNILKPGSILYNGQASVVNGHYTTTFIVPKDILYANQRGKITVFAWNSAGADAVGSNENITVGGTYANAHPETTGPVIKLYLDSRTFRSGDFASATPNLIVDLSDSTGINTSESSIGHGIEAWIDDSSSGIDLTADYQTALNDPTHGTAMQQLMNLSPGMHTVKVRAWNVYDIPSEASTIFVIATTGSNLNIANVMNIPDPFVNGTTFTLQQNQPTAIPVNVIIKIYTVAGRLIESLEQDGISQHFVEIPWNGLDHEGNRIANGVYLYKVIVKTSDGSQSTTAVGQMAVLR